MSSYNLTVQPGLPHQHAFSASNPYDKLALAAAYTATRDNRYQKAANNNNFSVSHLLDMEELPRHGLYGHAAAAAASGGTTGSIGVRAGASSPASNPCPADHISLQGLSQTSSQSTPRQSPNNTNVSSGCHGNPTGSSTPSVPICISPSNNSLTPSNSNMTPSNNNLTPSNNSMTPSNNSLTPSNSSMTPNSCAHLSSPGSPDDSKSQGKKILDLYILYI